MDDVAIKVENVSKVFKLPHEKTTSIKSAVVNSYKRKRAYEMQQVLNNISFEIREGEFFGIVGRNGSGKSTLLKLLAGIYVPTDGQVHIRGKLTPFIELGVGFNPELTGRENVYLNGALLGFNRKEMDKMYDDIVEFAELERFMDQKLKNYSSGMQVRLAFSIAIRARSDILILDEVLAVGDAAFQRKCYDYFMSLKRMHTTVVLVTHDMNAVRQYCDRAVMIEKGDIILTGSAEKVAQAYQRLFIEETNKKEKTNQPKDTKADDRWGTGQVLARKAAVDVKDGAISIHCQYEAQDDVPPPIYGFSIYNSAGVNIVEGNTDNNRIKTKPLRKGETVSFSWEMPNIFANGKYDVSFACCDQSKLTFYDWLNQAASFNISKEAATGGVVNPLVRLKQGKYGTDKTTR